MLVRPSGEQRWWTACGLRGGSAPLPFTTTRRTLLLLGCFGRHVRRLSLPHHPPCASSASAPFVVFLWDQVGRPCFTTGGRVVHFLFLFVFPQPNQVENCHWHTGGTLRRLLFSNSVVNAAAFVALHSVGESERTLLFLFVVLLTFYCPTALSTLVPLRSARQFRSCRLVAVASRATRATTPPGPFPPSLRRDAAG